MSDLGNQSRRAMSLKVYLVLLPDNVAQDGVANRKIIGAKLTREAAQKIVDRMPGAYIEKVIADKT